MPRVLKNHSISLLEAGIEMYKLALFGMSMPSSKLLHNSEAKFSPVMGLFGASAELLIKGCIVQANGYEAMFKNNDPTTNTFRFGNEVIEDFRIKIRDNDEHVKFIWKDPAIDSPDHIEQQEKILFYINKCKLLQELRADGLHAGMGCSRDIALSSANDIYSFIQILSQGKKLKAYLRNAPAPEATVIDREIIIEDLERRYNNSKDSASKISSIRNMFLVLPFIPEIPPDWIETFDRVAVSPPAEADVTYLAKTLSNAHSIYLLKNRGGKEGIPVRPEKDNPNAIPIAIQNIKRTLNSTPEKFNNDILTANTRLEEKRLDLPIDDFIIELFSIGLSEAGCFVGKVSKLTAQQVWPFVAAANSTQGTPRPCWFMISCCDELDQLLSFLKRVEPISNAYFKKRYPTLVKMIKAYQAKSVIKLNDEKEKVYNQINENISDTDIDVNPFSVSFLKMNSFSVPVNEIIKKYIAKTYTQEQCLIEMLQLETWINDDKKAANSFLQICVKQFNHTALVCAYQSDKLLAQRSQIRKAMFFADIKENGPSFSINNNDFLQKSHDNSSCGMVE